jgi:hypothetical protein
LIHCNPHQPLLSLILVYKTQQDNKTRPVKIIYKSDLNNFGSTKLHDLYFFLTIRRNYN